MLLQRFTDKTRWMIVALLALLVLVGCGGSAGVKSVDAPQQTVGSAEEGDAGELEPVIPARALTLFEQAAASMAAGDFVDAELRFKEFLLQFPEYPGAHVNLAIIHTSNGNDAAARSSIDSALAIDPNQPAALNQMGMLLRRNGNFLEAEAAYLKAVTVAPEYALAHYNLGVLNELYLQRLDTALQHFQTYQSLVGGDKQVGKWIADLTRRVAANQRTANVAD
jgi:tetratricopeptide (TPR) repeat protein